ncbi:thiamine-phosphate pyrophosphorylase [Aliarcobacter skirrowii]|jgi:thiamine-phosphate pyrophosphorylase|uniref:Thiamine-phosphate pyrophosphorylase n=2 Tax=Aliarcobacter skirrowii TaxID=28200 RepID=A0AAD0SMV4_9BACT|nr:thiamine-phosphate pyrophosphorylase [Aliarcobacter skirrowii]AXX85731.1 thiamine-phosphate pyrophosphorylase [Aliarcobacter skirrowii CCUG 10374]AZL54774.1 thiamine-phosphate pyrophosphorylase [Aliarcobacter skirrowii]KAB0622027.1 thiamine-phosphate pyrophosphorylase [Aliarcobacter skirrowii CCUG 10374]MCT7446637.1 thiamine-phosphate pyrophosphorylase [Aliarcobacter skirrowii]MDD2507403.1 thiamine-phosphate pyrophosphorylase [Aliarcobacter skirrowii]
MNNNFLRIIDANLNRLREGIRVVEDIFRYVYNDKELSTKLKDLRHLARVENFYEILESRDVQNDVLRESIKSEQNREDLNSILIANFKRAQESSRVLEELTKLSSIKDSENFKYIRYELYILESVLTKITSNSK